MRRLLLAAVVLSLAVSCHAFQNESDGFRGVNWGENISTRKDMTFISSVGKQKLEKIYSRKNEVNTLEKIKLISIQYVYLEDKFSEVKINFAKKDFESMKRICFSKFGKVNVSKMISGNHYVWNGTRSSVILTINPITDASGSTSRLVISASDDAFDNPVQPARNTKTEKNKSINVSGNGW